MFKAIVVGTDGSVTANEAVQQAIGLAAAHSAELHVVCALRLPAMAMAAPEAMAAGALVQLEMEQGDGTKRLLEDAASKATAAGVRVSTHATTGEPAEVLIEVAEQTSADLIVVGNRGMAGARRFLLGSVPNRVSHHAPCSVMIVRTC
jgi:nucleotide-binding universal stress UspA family protein